MSWIGARGRHRHRGAILAEQLERNVRCTPRRCSEHRAAWATSGSTPSSARPTRTPERRAESAGAARAVLDATLQDKDAEPNARSAEALAAHRLEEERVFVAAILGATRDVVYWNWRYGYTVKSYESRTTPERQRFNTDLTKRPLAGELAGQRYGELVTHVSEHNPR